MKKDLFGKRIGGAKVGKSGKGPEIRASDYFFLSACSIPQKGPVIGERN
jgi:hypothetical protein